MIDLHTHTNHSDGTDLVSELLEKANKIGIEILSITDHDSTGAYYELEKLEIRKKFSGKIITGCEMKTYYEKVPIEILAYGVDYQSLRVHEVKKEGLEKDVLEKMKSVARKIGLKYDEETTYIDINDPTRQFAASTFGRELLRHEENKEIIEKIGSFSDGYASFFRVHQCNADSMFYVDETYALIDIYETIHRIHEAGGLAFLAHPYIYPYKNKDEIIEKLISLDILDGMECIYPTFSKEEMEKSINLCKKYNKFMSGGTDYHAKNKPNISLGTGINENMKIEKSFIEDWINKVKVI